MPEMNPKRLTMEDVAVRHFARRDAARRRKMRRLGCTPGWRARRWKQGSYGLGMIFLVIGLLAVLTIMGSEQKASGVDYGIVVLLLGLAFLEFQDGWRGPPMKEGVPPWALERDGPAAVAEYEAKLRAEREADAR